MKRSKRRSRVALLVDGESEQSLAYLYPALAEATGNAFVRPVFVGVNGMSRPDRIASACVSRIQLIESREGRLNRVVILLDREMNPTCPGALRADIEGAVTEKIQRLGGRDVAVVIKNRKFENWLVADTQALESLTGRFRFSRRQLHEVAPDGADNILDAEAMLKSAAIKPGYNKTRDAVEIMRRADPLRIAANSRSFRRLLRCIGHPQYGRQSRNP